MSVFGVTAVKLDPNDFVKEVTIRQLDPKTNAWIGEPWLASGPEVATMISQGDEVLPIFVITGKTVPSPKFQRVVLPNGVETIDLAESSPGQTLQDLIHNVQDQS